MGVKQELYLDLVEKCLKKQQPISHIISMIKNYNDTLTRQTILADLIASLIIKYAGVLELDNLPNPTPVNYIEDKNRFDIAKIQIDNK